MEGESWLTLTEHYYHCMPHINSYSNYYTLPLPHPNPYLNTITKPLPHQ